MQSCTCKGNKKKWFYGIEICLFSCFSESVVEGGGKGSGMVDFCVFMCWLLWGYVAVVVGLGWWFGCVVIAVDVSGFCEGNVRLPRRMCVAVVSDVCGCCVGCAWLPRRRLDGVIKQ